MLEYQRFHARRKGRYDGGFQRPGCLASGFRRWGLARLRVASEKRFDVIAVCKLDRFFRDLRLMLNYLYVFEKLGIKFVSTQESLDTSNPSGKFVVNILGIVAEFERGRIGERVKDARHYLISKGNWSGGNTPYAYRWNNDEKKWSIEPDEKDIVRKVYDL